MRAKTRRWFFAVSGIALLALFLAAVRNMVPFGHYRGPYGDVLNQVTVYERHVTDVVTAVNFDFRGIDTLGEESILFLSVLGTSLLLRRHKGEEEAQDEQQDQSEQRVVPRPSAATRVTTLGLIGPLVVFGIYIITHGQLTPGGGFQGGVILATAPLLVYLAGDLKTFKRITGQQLVELGEAAGLGGFLGIGLLGMITSGAYLENVLPFGTTGDVFSGGTIPLISLATGIAVGAGFVLLMSAFLEQTLELRLRGRR
jgi:multicomponent Na+:H+ antiporter subunit B